MNASLAAGLLFTYGGASLAIFLAAARFLGVRDTERWQLAGLCAGLGPAAISRVLTGTYYAFPGHSNAFYIAAVLVPFGLLAAYGAASARSVRTMPADMRGAITQRGMLACGGTICVALALGFTVTSGPGKILLQSAYAAYASHWTPSGPWWQESMTVWGLVALAVAILTTLMLGFTGRGLNNERNFPGLRRLVLSALLGGSCLFLLGAIFMLTLGRPVYENDAVQYFKVATLMYERSSLAFYPLVPAVADDGMWAPSSHPLGYYGMLIWSFLINASAAPGPAKLVAPVHLVFCIMAMGMLMARTGWIAFLAAALLVISTPAVFLQTVGLGIDAPRLFLLVILTAWLHKALQHDDWRTFVLAGIVGGLCINSHSVNGLVTPFILAVVILGCYRTSWERRVAMLALTGVVTLAIGGERYLLNIMKFDSPVYDHHIIWDLVPSLDYMGWRAFVLHTDGVWSRLLAGPFIGLAHWYEWGLAFWVSCLGAILLWRGVWADQAIRIALLSGGVTLIMLVVYFGFVSSSVDYALNYRYTLTAFPLLAIAGGAWLGRLFYPSTTRA